MATLVIPGAYVGISYSDVEKPAEDVIQTPAPDPGGGGGAPPVGPPVLVSIAVLPANPTIPDNGSQQFQALGTYSYGPQVDLTNEVSWLSTTPGVATVHSGTGLATGVYAGYTVIRATYTAPLGGQVQGQTTLTVTPILVSIAVTPETDSVTVGNSVQFTATGTYSDGSTADLSSVVTWQSSDTDYATTSSGGLATGVAETLISVIISATLGLLGDTATLDVTEAAIPAHEVGANTMHMWRLDEAGNTDTVIDDKATTHLANVTNTTAVVSAINGARRFNAGTSPSATAWGYTSVADYTAIKARGWSMGMWIRGTTATDFVVRLAQLPHQGTGTWDRYLLRLSFGYYGPAPGALSVGTAPSGADYFDTASLDLLDGNWHHLVLVDRASHSTSFKLYVDGVCYKNELNDPYLNGGSGEPWSPSTNPQWILGAENQSPDGTNMHNLELDEVWIEKTEYSQAQVITEYGAPVCVSIAVTPDGQVVGIGGTLQLTAMGTFSDASVRDITSKVHWFSLDPAFATVDKYTGLVMAVDSGPANIVARLGTFATEILQSNGIVVNVS
jgi:uncharacterized protein YjdB